MKDLAPSRLALCLILAGLAACHKPAAEAPAENAGARDSALTLSAAQMDRMGIKVAGAEAAEAWPVGTVPGVISLPPDARVAVTTPFAGTVLRIMVIQGQPVRKGEALAVVHAAEAVQYGAALARSQAELPVAAARAARMDQLAREGIIAPARADEARAALAATRATVAENRRLLAWGGAGRDGTVTLRAPISGQVATVSVDTGAVVGTGAAPFIVENREHLRADLQIPERLAGQIHPGMGVVILQEGRSVTGSILSVSESLDPTTRSLTAKASLPPGSGFVPGKSVMAAITAQGKAGAVTVPASAVTHGEGGDMVFVRTVGGFRPARVTAIGQIGDRLYLSSGLRAGDNVAVSGVVELKSISQGQ